MLNALLTRTAHLAVHRRRTVIVLTVLLMAAAGVLGSGVFSRLAGGGFADPAAESSRAAATLDARFGTGAANLVLVVTVEGGVDDAQAASAGAALTRDVAAEPGVADVVSYWSLGRSQGAEAGLRSADGSRALLLARAVGDEDAAARTAARIAASYAGDGGPLRVDVGGVAGVDEEITSTIERDLALAEAVAIPITMVLLVLVFGSVVSATLPLLVGGIAIVGAFLSLFLVTLVTDVSIFSINLVTGLGLGLGIDYALFVVSRYREELARRVGVGDAVEQAVMATVTTAGRTVVFSGITVALSLAAMLVFPLYFLRSFAYAGIAVVLLAVTGAVVVLPAVLALLGRRVDALTVLRRSTVPAEEGLWSRVASTVMRRPVPIALGVVTVLLALATPFLGVQWGQPDDRALPAGSAGRAAGDAVREHFAGRAGDAFPVVLTGTAPGDVGGSARSLSQLDGVARVDAATGRYAGGALLAPAGDPSRFAPRDAGTGTWLSVTPDVEPYSDAGAALVGDVRSTPAPSQALVGGPAAVAADTAGSLGSRLPWALAMIVMSVGLLLFLFTGSVVVPLKALLLNLLSLTATFGAMVWVFQEGHLSGLLGFTATGTLPTAIPILMFCIAFGLSMDYEVFLLSRIGEEYRRTGDNTAAVRLGLQRTGRIVTAAAALLAVVFVAIGTSQVMFIKLMGLGIALAVVMDATLVRGLLVPAFMRLAGRWNWWAPAPLRRLHDRLGVAEDPHHRADPGPRPAGHRQGTASAGADPEPAAVP